jgi:hypothetical protein
MGLGEGVWERGQGAMAPVATSLHPVGTPLPHIELFRSDMWAGTARR